MKTTTDNHIDKLLHEAMKQRAAKVPPLADDFAEKVLGSLTPRPLQKKRGLKFWPLVVAACVAGFVVIFLAPPRTTEEQLPLALEEPVVTEQPVTKEEPVKVEAQTQTESPSGKPKRTPKRKRVVPQEPQEEPLLAEAETRTEEVYHEAPKANDPLLAVAAQFQDIRSRGERLGREIAQLTDNQIKYQ